MRAIPQIQNPAIKQWCAAVLKVPSSRPSMPSTAEQDEFREFTADYPDLHCYDFQAFVWGYLLKHSLTLTPETEHRLLSDPEMQPFLELIRSQVKMERLISENPEIRAGRDWLAFWYAHLDISPCDANKKMISDWIAQIPDTVNAESLERAIADPKLKATLAKAEPPKPKQEQELPKTVAVTPTATPTPSTPAFTLTKQQVAAASKDQMRSWMSDEPKGALAALESLGIKTKLPARWRQ